MSKELIEQSKKYVSDGQKQMRITVEELEIIKRHFGGEEGDRNLKMLRKLFIPTIDTEAPYMTVIDLFYKTPIKELKERSAEQIKQEWLARNELIDHLETRFLELHTLANAKEETPEERAKRLEKNSSK